MSTQYADLFAALAAPFAAGEVRSRTQGGRTFDYVTARVVMNRLDAVVGPESWWDDYFPHNNSVLCRLTVRLPDGTTLTKADAGGHAGMSDSGDDEKSGYSDALKRAAVKFGVGRYLYRDGVADLTGEGPVSSAADTDRHPVPPSQGRPSQTGGGNSYPARPNGDRPFPPPTNGKALFAWAKDQSTKFDVELVKWLDKWGQHKNLPGKFTEWSQAEIAEGHKAAVAMLDKYLLAGKGDAYEGPDDGGQA